MYEPRIFASGWETQIEHMVAAYEAHISGLCDRTVGERRAFASDLNNYTLASPELNREKGSGDAAYGCRPMPGAGSRGPAARQAPASAAVGGRGGGSSTGDWPPVQSYRNCTATDASNWRQTGVRKPEE